MFETAQMTRRRLLADLMLPVMIPGVIGHTATAAYAAQPTRTKILVHKDPNCGCCTAWAGRIKADGRFAPSLINEPDMTAVKIRLRVPPELISCHTSEVGRFVIEGHVPPAEIARLLKDKPAGVIGLAVPGMPAGSPGMEVPNGRRDAYDVIAFTADGRQSIFARYR